MSNIKTKRHFSIKTGYSILLLGFAFLISCNNRHNNKITDKTALYNWLKKPEHVDQKNYRDTFETVYSKLLTSNKILEAATLLDAYGNALDLRYEYDSNYVVICKTFLQKNENQLDGYHQIALYYFIGSQYDFKNEIDSSDLYLAKINIETSNNEALKLKGFAGIILYSHCAKKGKYDMALKQCLQNLKLFETIKDSVNVATTYLNMSDVYKQIKMYDESKLYNTKSLSIALAARDTQNIWIGFVNNVRPYGQNFDKDTMLIYARKLKTLYDLWSHKSDYFSSTTNFFYGFALLHNNKLDSVQLYLDKAFVQCKNNTLLQFDLLATNADLDNVLKRPIRNEDKIAEAYKIATIEKDQKYQETFAEILSNIAFQKRDYKNAYDYNIKKYTLRDSAWTLQTRADITSLDKKYQTAKKEKTIAAQKSEITALLFSIAVIILSALIFFGYRKRKEAQDEVIRQQKFTDELMQNTEDERKRIATDLHDGVNHELLTLKNQANKGKTINSDEIEKVINEVRQVSRDLYPAMFDNIGLVASIEALCERMTEAGLFTSCEINYTLKLSKQNELQLYRIIQEALNNTLKHAKADAAKVTIDTIGNELLVEIKDNGIGFDADKKMNNASSFGIQSLMQRARAIGGKSTIESDKNGTKLILKTPIH